MVTGAVINSVAADNNFEDNDRHERENYPGVISGLSGTVPNQTFTLTRGNDSFVVQCSVDTRIDRSGGNGNPVLADGQHVRVRGSFNLAQNRLDAERVKITGGNGNNDEDEAYGNVSNIGSGPGTLDLTVGNVEGFQPSGNPIHVTTTGGTIYRNRAGATITKDEFFALLVNNDLVEAEGSYSSGSNTLIATKLKFEDGEDEHDDNAEVTGATSLVNTEAFTFKVAATEFSGFSVPPGTLLTVVTDGDTTFRGLSGGNNITRSEFFTMLNESPGRLAEVEGHWNGTTLTAKKCKLEDNL